MLNADKILRALQTDWAAALASRIAGGDAAVRFLGVDALALAAAGAVRRFEAARPSSRAARLDPPIVARQSPPSHERCARLALLTIAAAGAAPVNGGGFRPVFDRLGQVALSEAEQTELFAQFAQPPRPDQLAKEADGLTEAALVYAVALLTLEPGMGATNWLEELGRALGIPSDLESEIRAAVLSG